MSASSSLQAASCNTLFQVHQRAHPHSVNAHVNAPDLLCRRANPTVQKQAPCSGRYRRQAAQLPHCCSDLAQWVVYNPGMWSRGTHTREHTSAKKQAPQLNTAPTQFQPPSRPIRPAHAQMHRSQCIASWHSTAQHSTCSCFHAHVHATCPSPPSGGSTTSCIWGTCIHRRTHLSKSLCVQGRQRVWGFAGQSVMQTTLGTHPYPAVRACQRHT